MIESDSPLGRLKRRTYLSVLVVAVVGTLASLGLEFLQGTLFEPSLWPRGAALALYSWLLWAVFAKRVELHLVEAIGLYGISVLFLWQVVLEALAGHPTPPSLHLTLVAIAVSCLITVSRDVAARFMASLYVTSFALPALVALARDEPVTSALNLDLLAITGAVLALLFFLSTYNHHLGQQRLETEEMRRLAFTDAVTGVANRRKLYEVLNGTLKTGVSIVLLDLDHFKSVNDRFGHEAGDAVLREVARRLRSELRPHDSLGRWGGEEFLVVLPDTSSSEAASVAERLWRALRAHPFRRAGRVTGSFGVATARTGDSTDRLVSRADARLYQAKQLGRDRVVWSDANHPMSETTLILEE
ncbi:GGDEF domain-containing protein [Deinococcus yavapaiensis]|nr:GGDEF domain-containing protein [Deinococcus yavapaiensis]